MRDNKLVSIINEQAQAYRKAGKFAEIAVIARHLNLSKEASASFLKGSKPVLVDVGDPMPQIDCCYKWDFGSDGTVTQSVAEEKPAKNMPSIVRDFISKFHAACKDELHQINDDCLLAMVEPCSLDSEQTDTAIVYEPPTDCIVIMEPELDQKVKNGECCTRGSNEAEPASPGAKRLFQEAPDAKLEQDILQYLVVKCGKDPTFDALVLDDEHTLDGCSAYVAERTQMIQSYGTCPDAEMRCLLAEDYFTTTAEELAALVGPVPQP